MKIAIDISQIVYETGVSNYTKNLVKNLLKIDKHNHYILFGTSLRQIGKLKEFTNTLREYKKLDIKILPIPITLARIVIGKLRVFPINKFTGAVDVFHSSDWIEPRVNGQTKKVSTVHDLIVYLFPSSTHAKITSAAKERLALVKKESDSIIADSKTTKEDLIKFLAIPEEKIEVIYLAPSSEFKPQDDEKVKNVLDSYKIKKPYILSVSTQEPRKNIQKLIDSYARILDEYPSVNLVLVGKQGWGQLPIVPIENGGRIIETGFVPQKDLPAIYCGARVFAYPSLYEGFGLPVLEAMACGTPVITSNNSSMAEIAKDVAILVDPRNEAQIVKAIKLVLSLDMEKYQTMVRESMRRAREYSWQRTARQTLGIYEKLGQQNIQMLASAAKN